MLNLEFSLDLEGTDITGDALPMLPPFFAQRYLGLNRTSLTDRGLATLAVEPESLDVSETGVQLGPAAAAWLAGLTNPIEVWAEGHGIPPERAEPLGVPDRIRLFVGPLKPSSNGS